MSQLKQIREGKGLRREQVAAAAGISLQYVRDLEDDKSNPSLPIARKVAAALGVTVDDVWPTNFEATA